MTSPTHSEELATLTDLEAAFDDVTFDVNRIVKFGIGIEVNLAGHRLRWLSEDSNQLANIARKLCHLIN
ncbi:MAG: hypothetical protein WCP01_16960, partial [Methylococcaceae bacterium]